MNFKNFVGAILVGLIFFTNTVAVQAAYDLPKIKIEKPKKISKQVKEDDKKIFKSDWKSFEIFSQNLKSILAENDNLPAAAKERISVDKNLIFVGFYKDNLYFLDRYSIKIKKNTATEKSWQQMIFPVGAKISSQNTQSTLQKFYTDNKNIFNSTKAKNNLTDIEDADDKKFMLECFKVGYYYTFNEEFNLTE